MPCKNVLKCKKGKYTMYMKEDYFEATWLSKYLITFWLSLDKFSLVMFDLDTSCTYSKNN